MSIGEKLKKLRHNSKKTLREVSEAFGVSLNSVYRWEHDLCAPKKTVVRKIAQYYDVPYEWLTGGGIEDVNTKCDDCILNPERSTEQKILKMLKKLSANSKYKILGYIERMCVEEEDEIDL